MTATTILFALLTTLLEVGLLWVFQNVGKDKPEWPGVEYISVGLVLGMVNTLNQLVVVGIFG